MMTRSLLLGAAASLALGSTNIALADGWYIGLEGGANWIDDWDHTYFTTNGAGTVTDSSLATAGFDTGWAVLATVGYGFGGGWRVEVEGGYRDNDADSFAISGVPVTATSVDLAEATMMLNVLYDIPLTGNVSLSLGAGAGADYGMLDLRGVSGNFDDDRWSFAYQGIAGLNYALGQHTSLFVNYRYLRVTEPDFDFRPAFEVYVAGDEISKHTATVGLRYSFGQAAAEPMVAAPPPPPPPPAEPMAPREYIVFFGHNKSNLTAEALDVIRQAAAAAKQYGSATITVVGHADRSGSASYNEKLSLRRANAVKGALVSDGISASSVSVSGKGESDPMVPTADGVREPQNRRVHISL
jgi:outer membrane protein OmpA-like peptidoglycan-associated protein